MSSGSRTWMEEGIAEQKERMEGGMRKERGGRAGA